MAPTVALKAQIASQEDRQHLANALFYLRHPSAGSADADVVQLSSLIHGWVELIWAISLSHLNALHSLVVELGLQSNLSEYNVPTEDIPKIAAGALGREDDPHRAQVVKLLQGLYQDLFLKDVKL